MNDRERQIWMLAIGCLFLALIALTFTSRKPWYLITLGVSGVKEYQFPTEQDCKKAKAYVDSAELYLLTQCSEGK